jgi:hypothetical protein
MSLIKPYNNNRSHISFIFMRNDDYANDPHLVPVPLLDQFGYSWGWPTSVENAQAYNQEYYAILGWKAYINRDLTFDNKSFYFNENMAKNLYINRHAIQAPQARESARRHATYLQASILTACSLMH